MHIETIGLRIMFHCEARREVRRGRKVIGKGQVTRVARTIHIVNILHAPAITIPAWRNNSESVGQSANAGER